MKCKNTSNKKYVVVCTRYIEISKCQVQAIYISHTL